MTFLLTHFNYIAFTILMVGGLFIILTTGNLIRKMIGLAIFQTTIGVLYITLGKVAGGTAAIKVDADSDYGRALAAPLNPAYVAEYGVNGVVYSNPLPHVLILTAIVVGVATLSVGLAIAVRVREAYGTVEDDEILEADIAEGQKRAEDSGAAA
jgi:multicomponent Na+:H+ antiporter subunit C